MNSTESGGVASVGAGTLRYGPSDYLAAERTFLAWIRTGIALMGFGFVVARFGLFLQEFQVVQPNAHVHSSWLSLVFGTVLIAIGVAVNIFSTWQHVRLVRGLNLGGTAYRRPSSLAIAVALVLAVIGVALAVYLTLFRGAEMLHAGNEPGRAIRCSAGNGGEKILIYRRDAESGEKVEG
ncbi:MAG: DUF202 domain-containing protein [Candidatus Acidiferrales bacterium]